MPDNMHTVWIKRSDNRSWRVTNRYVDPADAACCAALIAVANRGRTQTQIVPPGGSLNWKAGSQAD